MQQCELCKEPACTACEQCGREVCLIHVNNEQASDCVFMYCTDCVRPEVAEEDLE